MKIHQIDTNRTDSDALPNLRHLLIVGGGPVGLSTAEYLADSVEQVTFAGNVSEARAGETAVPVVSRAPDDAADVRAIRDAVADVDVVVAVGGDIRTFFLGHLCNQEFDPAVTVATINDPSGRDAFIAAGVEPVPVPELLADHISSHVQQAEDP